MDIENKVKDLANEIHSAFANAYAINESISHEWLKNIIKESFTQYHQDLMSDVVTEVCVLCEPLPSANDHKEYNRGKREGVEMIRNAVLTIIKSK